MAEVFAYLYGFGAGGDFTKSVIIVTAPTGSTVTCTKGTTVKTATEKNGEWWFKNLDTGTWTVKATLSGQTTTQTVNITQYGVYRIAIVYRITPDFTYSGDYQVVQDNDAPISDFANWKGNWKIRFLTSGTFTITNMYGWNGNIDVFLVGGGGGTGSYYTGGAGGGYTTTTKNKTISANVPYDIVIGSGGNNSGGNGGNTTAFESSANGGKGVSSRDPNGGNGGSGGGTYQATTGGNGGSDGNDGQSGQASGGTGQGTTTKELEEPSGKLYSGGGAGGSVKGITGTGGEGGGAKPGEDAEDNTGGGAGGGKDDRRLGSTGGSGIVIIRNAREAA